MRVSLKQQCMFFVLTVVVSACLVSSSTIPARDHKKKLLEKLRNALNQTELEEVGVFNVTLEDLKTEQDRNSTTVTVQVDDEEGAEAKTTLDEELPPSSEEKVEDSVVQEKEDKEKEDKDKEGKDKEDKDKEDKDKEDKDKEDKDKEEGEKKPEKEKSESTELQKEESGPASYLRKMRSVLMRMFELFGFRQSKKKEGRQNRMLTNDDSYKYNGLEYEYLRDDIRTTVGAVLGEKECIEKIVCGAGTYLREVNGKNVILTVLENVTPSAWIDTMELLKASAVTDGDCQYKCLEDTVEEEVEEN